MFETSSDQQSQSSVIVVSNNSVVVGNGLNHSVASLSPHHNVGVAVSSAVDLKSSNNAITTAINDAIVDVIDHHHHHHNGSSNCHIISSYYYCTANLINLTQPHLHHFNIFNLSSATAATAAAAANNNRHNHTTSGSLSLPGSSASNNGANNNMCTSTANSTGVTFPTSTNLKSTSDLLSDKIAHNLLDNQSTADFAVNGEPAGDETSKICINNHTSECRDDDETNKNLPKATENIATVESEEPSASKLVESFNQKVVIDQKANPLSSSSTSNEAKNKKELENITTENVCQTSSKRLFKTRTKPAAVLKHRRSLRLANQKSGVVLGENPTTRSKTRKFSAFLAHKLSKLASSSSSISTSRNKISKKRSRVVSSKSLFNCLSDQTSSSSICHQHAVFKEHQSPSISSSCALLAPVVSATTSVSTKEPDITLVVRPTTPVEFSSFKESQTTKKCFFKRKIFKGLKPSKRLKSSNVSKDKNSLHDDKAVDDDVASLCNLPLPACSHEVSSIPENPVTDTHSQQNTSMQNEEYDYHNSSSTTSSSSLTSPSSSCSILEVAYAESNNILREMIMPDNNCFESLNGIKKPEFATLSNPFDHAVQAFQSSPVSSFADMDSENSPNNVCSTSTFSYNTSASCSSQPSASQLQSSSTSPSLMQQNHMPNHHHQHLNPHQHQMHTDLLFSHQQQLNPFTSDIEMIPMGHQSLHQVSQSQQEFLFDNRTGICGSVSALASAAHSTTANVATTSNNLIKQDLLKLSYDKFKQYRLNEKLLPQTVLIRNAIKLLQYDLQYQQEQEQQQQHQQIFLQQQQQHLQQQQQQMEFMMSESEAVVMTTGLLNNSNSISNQSSVSRYSSSPSATASSQQLMNHSFGPNKTATNVNNIISMIPYENLEEFFNRSEFVNNPMMLQHANGVSSSSAITSGNVACSSNSGVGSHVNANHVPNLTNQGATNPASCFYVNIEGSQRHDQIGLGHCAADQCHIFYHGASVGQISNSEITDTTDRATASMIGGSSHQTDTSSTNLEGSEEDDEEEDEEEEEEDEDDEDEEEEDEEEGEGGEDEDEEEDEGGDCAGEDQNGYEEDDQEEGDDNDNPRHDTRKDKQIESNEQSSHGEDHDERSGHASSTKGVQEPTNADSKRNHKVALSSSSATSASSSVSSSSSSDITLDENFYVDIDNFEHDDDYEENGLLGSRTSSYSISTYNHNEFNSLANIEHENIYGTYYRPSNDPSALQTQYSSSLNNSPATSNPTATSLLSDTTTNYNNLVTVSSIDTTTGHYITSVTTNSDANCKPYFLASSSTHYSSSYNPTNFNENDESKT